MTTPTPLPPKDGIMKKGGIAYITKSHAFVELVYVSDAQMDVMYRNDVLGMPVYHSPDGRVWPRNDLSGLLIKWKPISTPSTQGEM